MRIAIFNVKYSPNLGDGLLSECLEAELRAQGAGLVVESIDLAGRAGYGEGGRYRRSKIALLERLPTRLRRLVARVALRRLVRRRLAPAFRAALVDSDAVVLGGGNLIADADLNFPMKIASALAEARALPVGVFGVGVSDNWSEAGKRLFATAFEQADLAHVAVRDMRSREIWQRRLGASVSCAPVLCRDPGLLTARHFPREAGEAGIGLCITDPLALRYHGSSSADRRLEAWLVTLAELLVQAGHRITLFTNGSPEDRDHLALIAPRFRAACGDAVAVAPAFATPADLARFVASCSMVLAHRMHACIAAYSYAIPHVGFAWDPKLDSFFESVGRSKFMLDPAALSPARAAAVATQALAEGIAPACHAAVLAEAAVDVGKLYKSLVAAVAR